MKVQENELEWLMCSVFLTTDQVEKNNLHIAHCNTNDMLADFFTEGIVGPKFEKFRSNVMGFQGGAWLHN